MVVSQVMSIFEIEIAFLDQLQRVNNRKITKKEVQLKMLAKEKQHLREPKDCSISEAKGDGRRRHIQ